MKWFYRINSFVKSQNICLSYWPKWFISEQAKADNEINEFLFEKNENNFEVEISPSRETLRKSNPYGFFYGFSNMPAQNKKRTRYNHVTKRERQKEKKSFNWNRVKSCSAKLKKKSMVFNANIHWPKDSEKSLTENKTVVFDFGEYVPYEFFHSNEKPYQSSEKMEYQNDVVEFEFDNEEFCESIEIRIFSGKYPNLDEQECVRDFSTIPNAYSGLWESDIECEEEKFLPEGFGIVTSPNFRRLKGGHQKSAYYKEKRKRHY